MTTYTDHYQKGRAAALEFGYEHALHLYADRYATIAFQADQATHGDPYRAYHDAALCTSKYQTGSGIHRDACWYAGDLPKAYADARTMGETT